MTTTQPIRYLTTCARYARMYLSGASGCFFSNRIQWASAPYRMAAAPDKRRFLGAGLAISGGWTLAHKQTRNAKSQELARKRIIKARGESCEDCGRDGPIELHHKQRAVDGGTFADDNLILLCSSCHLKAHGQQRHRRWYDDDPRLARMLG